MYTVHIEIGANTSKYWASMRFEDSKGITHEKKIKKERSASRNSNHIQALLEAVEVLQRPCMLDVYTSSEYLIEPFKQGWIVNWERNSWTNAKGKEVRNAEQWKKLRKALAPHSARFMYKEELS